MSSVRAPAVAGLFYPGEAAALRDAVDRLLGEMPLPRFGADRPRALIAPHAGYAYSGPVAASAFGRVAGAGATFTRVVVIGPSHYVAFRGIAAPRASAFATPLGEIPVDHAAIAGIPGVQLADEPHRREHAIEVELPFLQRALGRDRFGLVPLVVGDATGEEVAAALASFADDPKTLVVVSSDLSHFLPYEAAARRDQATAAAIERLEGDEVRAEDACGWLPIRGWLAWRGSGRCGSSGSICATVATWRPGIGGASSATAPGHFGATRRPGTPACLRPDVPRRVARGDLTMRQMSEAHFAVLRRHMVEVIAIHAELAEEELGKAALDPRVLAAMADVPRHRFVPSPLAALAYHDAPLPIGFDKTISQPFIVAVMTDLLAPLPTDSVLEVGTGLGYQTAILARLAGRVWSVEVVEELALEAEARLARLGYPNVEIRVGDGSRGWAEHAPFDKILVAAAAEVVPPALVEQLRPGGRMVLPLGGEEAQALTVVDKDDRGPGSSGGQLLPVRFSRLETMA